MLDDSPPRRSLTQRTAATLAGRLRLIRAELFGERGGPELAHLLGLPALTWANYESGVTIPGDVLLRFLTLTGAEPAWLLRGEGRKYRHLLPEPPPHAPAGG